MEFDYIIAGAGAAGCLLANRLSADPAHSVLLLEAGQAPHGPWTRIPVGYRYTIGNPAWDWCHTSLEPTLAGRTIKHPRGKALGGSTVINGMEVVRGQAADYDAWRDLGLVGWGWEDVLPCFKRHEDFAGGADEHHGAGGEWRVEHSRVHWPLQDQVVAACLQAGIPTRDDFNRGDHFGAGPMQLNQRQGRRWRADDGFLSARVRARGNLHILTGALVDRVLLDGVHAGGPDHAVGGARLRAQGLVWRPGPGAAPVSARARKAVVLAAGAFGSPTVLMRSGIGPAATLAQHGIRLAKHTPGVGANLQDHLQIGMRYRLRRADTLNRRMHSWAWQAWMAARYALTASGPLSMAPCQVGIFAKSRPQLARADLAYNVLPFSRSVANDGISLAFDREPGMTMIFYDMRPSSTGRVTISSADPAADPLLHFNYLSTERDLQVATDGVRTTRRIMRQAAVASMDPREDWLGASVPDHDESGLRDAVRAAGSTIFHPVGTAKMGLASDPMAVVDARLRVHGVDGLRVIDASVMPTVTSGNTCTPTLMVAEKGAEMLLQDAR